MTDKNTISQVVESLFEDWIDKNINVHPLAVENMRTLEADAIALLKEQGVKTGHWIESKCRDKCFWVCSECSFPSEAIAAPKLYKYCPNCGIKMDGKAIN